MILGGGILGLGRGRSANFYFMGAGNCRMLPNVGLAPSAAWGTPSTHPLRTRTPAIGQPGQSSLGASQNKSQRGGGKREGGEGRAVASEKSHPAQWRGDLLKGTWGQIHSWGLSNLSDFWKP